MIAPVTPSPSLADPDFYNRVTSHTGTPINHSYGSAAASSQAQFPWAFPNSVITVAIERADNGYILRSSEGKCAVCKDINELSDALKVLMTVQTIMKK
jgi:hypothetical protein